MLLQRLLAFILDPTKVADGRGFSGLVSHRMAGWLHQTSSQLISDERRLLVINDGPVVLQGLLLGPVVVFGPDVNGALFQEHVGAVALTACERLDVLVLLVDVKPELVFGGESLATARALEVLLLLMERFHVVEKGLFVLQNLTADLADLLHCLVAVRPPVVLLQRLLVFGLYPTKAADGRGLLGQGGA